jgi:hypothetical protein
MDIQVCRADFLVEENETVVYLVEVRSGCP